MNDLTLPYEAMYVSKTTGKKSISLREICREEDQLTIDPTSHSGFKEIGIYDIRKLIIPQYKHLITDLEKLEDHSVEDIANILLNKTRDYLIDSWDSNYPHVVFHSGGADSRIISYLLLELEEEMGKDWIGDLKFLCFKPEQKQFLDVMKRQGRSKDQYHVHKINEPLNVEYYNLGKFEYNANSFWDMSVVFWDEIIDNEKDWVVVSGIIGGVLFGYPLWKAPLKTDDNRFENFIKNAVYPNFSTGRFSVNWKDIIAPFLGYDYLETAFRVPMKYIRLHPNSKQDLIRKTMLELIGDDLPFYWGSPYNWQKTNNWIKYIKNKFLNSKLYNDYIDVPFVRNAKPWAAKQPRSDEIKLYSLATMYEGI